MPSLSAKLKSLGVQVGTQHLQPKPAVEMSTAYPIEQIVAGHFHQTLFGKLFVAESRLPQAYRHGRAGLWTESSLDLIANWSQDERLARYPLDQFAFIDTETSGLAGGTGTYAFLIGAGRFEGDKFRLAQFFMRDPGEEQAQLAALTEFLRPCRVMVTFNGKSFDIPLLNTRYTLNQQPSPLIDLAHLDLLPLARRIWRDRLPSRRLADLETQILEAERTEEDVSGWVIPALYFDYLRSGDSRPLKGIFYHNREDVVTMAALLNHMAQMMSDPTGPAVEYALDLIAIGKLYEHVGQYEAAVQLLMQGMARHDLPEEHYWKTQRHLSFLHKRQKNLLAAVEVWQLAAEGRQIYAHVELAKFYEHRQRNYPQAIHWTQTALDLLEVAQASRRARREWLADLQHRMARLQRKLEKSESG